MDTATTKPPRDLIEAAVREHERRTEALRIERETREAQRRQEREEREQAAFELVVKALAKWANLDYDDVVGPLKLECEWGSASVQSAVVSTWDLSASPEVFVALHVEVDRTTGDLKSLYPAERTGGTGRGWRGVTHLGTIDDLDALGDYVLTLRAQDADEPVE